MKTAYYAAKFKWGVLKLIGWAFHPWISDLAVRVYQHYPKYEEFFYVYRRALQAKELGVGWVSIDEKEMRAKSSTSEPKEPTNSVISMAAYRGRPRKKNKPKGKL
jgi:hypothetical protein